MPRQAVGGCAVTLRYAIGNGEYLLLSLPGAVDAAADFIEDLHFCRLGMKFLSAVPMPEFTEYAFGLGGGGEGEDAVEFRGVVVQNEPERGRYRVAIHFYPLPADQAVRIDAYSRRAHLRCDWCGEG